jgi:hypothetical protein
MIQQEKKSFVIKVVNRKVARDVIMEFYNQYVDSSLYRDIKYLSEMLECRNFFCLPLSFWSRELLYDINVSKEENFNLFMQIIDLFMQIDKDFDPVNDEHLMRTIKENISLVRL